MKEYNPQGGRLPHSLLPGVASYRRQPRAIESTTPVGLAHHQQLSQNKYMMVECDTIVYHKIKSRGKVHHVRLSQNKYMMVECDSTIYHKAKSRGKGTTLAVITEQIHHG